MFTSPTYCNVIDLTHPHIMLCQQDAHIHNCWTTGDQIRLADIVEAPWSLDRQIGASELATSKSQALSGLFFKEILLHSKSIQYAVENQCCRLPNHLPMGLLKRYHQIVIGPLGHEVGNQKRADWGLAPVQKSHQSMNLMIS